jgi:hypothetical protein
MAPGPMSQHAREGAHQPRRRHDSRPPRPLARRRPSARAHPSVADRAPIAVDVAAVDEAEGGDRSEVGVWVEPANGWRWRAHRIGSPRARTKRAPGRLLSPGRTALSEANGHRQRPADAGVDEGDEGEDLQGTEGRRQIHGAARDLTSAALRERQWDRACASWRTASGGRRSYRCRRTRQIRVTIALAPPRTLQEGSGALAARKGEDAPAPPRAWLALTRRARACKLEGSLARVVLCRSPRGKGSLPLSRTCPDRSLACL